MVLEDGRRVTAHCANTGSMAGLLHVDAPVLLSRSHDPRRRLPYSWEMVFIDGVWVGVYPHRANQLVREALETGAIPELRGYDTIRREVTFGSRSRLDFLLGKADGSRCYMEVKSVSLRREGMACFPDAVSERGVRHLLALRQAVAAGHRAVSLHVVQRPDCRAFRPAAEIDADYAATLKRVAGAGVEILAHACHTGPEGLFLKQPLPVVSG